MKKIQHKIKSIVYGLHTYNNILSMDFDINELNNYLANK